MWLLHRLIDNLILCKTCAKNDHVCVGFSATYLLYPVCLKSFVCCPRMGSAAFTFALACALVRHAGASFEQLNNHCRLLDGGNKDKLDKLECVVELRDLYDKDASYYNISAYEHMDKKDQAGWDFCGMLRLRPRKSNTIEGRS